MQFPFGVHVHGRLLGLLVDAVRIEGLEDAVDQASLLARERQQHRVSHVLHVRLFLCRRLFAVHLMLLGEVVPHSLMFYLEFDLREGFFGLGLNFVVRLPFPGRFPLRLTFIVHLGYLRG